MTATRICIAYALRAAILVLLAGGLLWVAGSEAAVVGTIAATVPLVAPLLAGVVLTWLASIARVGGERVTPWLMTQAAVVLVLALITPVISFPAPLIQSASAVWIFACLAFISGLIEVIGGAFRLTSRIAGATLVAGAVLLALVIILAPESALLAIIGPVGVVIGLMSVGMAVAATRAWGVPIKP